VQNTAQILLRCQITSSFIEKHDSAIRHNRFKIPLSEGKLVSISEAGVKFKISGDETRNAFSIVEHPVEPRTLVPPHVHHDTDDYSYVFD